jgi:hypothetical protein
VSRQLSYFLSGVLVAGLQLFTVNGGIDKRLRRVLFDSPHARTVG